MSEEQKNNSISKEDGFDSYICNGRNVADYWVNFIADLADRNIDHELDEIIEKYDLI